MRPAQDLVLEIGTLRQDDLDTWIRDDLVRPEATAPEPVFSDRECARVRLLCTLRYELEVEGDSLPLMLSLLDQLYETRGQLAALTAAVVAQDADVQRAILAEVTAPRRET